MTTIGEGDALQIDGAGKVRSSVAAALLLMVAVSLLSLQVAGAAETFFQADLQSELMSLRVSQGEPWGVIVPGYSATVMESGRGSTRIIAAASGASNPPKHPANPLLESERFRMGSITKTFTAALIMQLDAEGKLSLRDPISKWIDYPRGDRITVEMLLGHTSGIPSFDDFPGHSRDATPEESIALVRTKPLLFPSGKKWSYSNTNYVMLGLIASKVAKKPWGDIVTERFFKPLRLADTYVWNGTDKGRTAGGSRLNFGEAGEPKCDKPTKCFIIIPVPDGRDWKVAWAAGAIVSTPTDMAKWMLALASGRVVDARHLALMTRPTPQSIHALSSLPPFGRLRWTGEGLGLFNYKIDGVGAGWGHEGSINGFVSNAVYLPATGQAIAVASNFLQADSFAALGDIASSHISYLRRGR